MSEYIKYLYHWSPRERKDSILEKGLLTSQKSVDGSEFRQPAICFSPDPHTAWRYSYGTWNTEGTFDLWCISPEPSDNMEAHTIEYDEVVEFRIYSNIPESRLIWGGETIVYKTYD